MDLKQEIINKHMIRKSYKQKTIFIELIKSKYECTVESSSGIIKSRNIVIGDIKRASTIYTAHYDTPATLGLPNVIVPKNIFLLLLTQLIMSLVIVVPILVLTFITNSIIQQLYHPELSNILFNTLVLIESSSFMVYSGVMLFLLLAGVSNKNNYNDNTSGVVTLLKLIDNMSEEEKNNCAFVFFDNEEKGLLGSRYFKSKYKQESKSFTLVNFDCVGDGNNILIKQSRALKKSNQTNIYNSFDKNDNFNIIEDKGFCYFPSDQNLFKNSIAVAALKKHTKYGFYYLNKIHTNKDLILKEENVEYIVESIIKYHKENKKSTNQ